MKKSSKLLFSATICLLLTVILAATAFAARKLGDVDNREGITVDDARQVLRFAVNLDKPANDEIKAAADLNRDGKIDVNDARGILRISVKLDPTPNEDAVIKPQCTHNWQLKPVMQNKNWSTGKHIKTCTKCGATTGVEEACTLGAKVWPNGEPNCEGAARYYQECSVCHGKKQDTVKKLPHKFVEQTDEKGNYINVKITKEANCTEAGTKTITCILCNKKTKDVVIPAKGHTIPDRVLKENETVKCDVCGQELKPAKFDFDKNEFNIFASGKYYYEGYAKTLNGYYSNGTPRYETSDIIFAVNPGKSIYMQMPFDGNEIGYLAYVDKNLLGKEVERKYFHTLYEGTNYYFDISNLKSLMSALPDGGDSSVDEIDFPSPKDPEYNTKLDNVKLTDADMSLVVYQGKVCTRFTFTTDDSILRVFMDGQKLLLIEKCDPVKTDKNGAPLVIDATYFTMITADIPEFMRTATGKNSKILSGLAGLLEFANYIGITES